MLRTKSEALASLDALKVHVSERVHANGAALVFDHDGRFLVRFHVFGRCH